MKMIIPVKIGKMNLDTIICVLTKCFIWSVYGFTFSKKLRPKKKNPFPQPVFTEIEAFVLGQTTGLSVFFRFYQNI